MSFEIEKKLEGLGVTLPSPRPVFSNRLGSKRVGDKIYVSGHPSALLGEVGRDVTVDEAYKAAQQVAIACLSTIGSLVDSFDDILGFDKLTGFVRSSPNFVDQASVINGASDIIVDLFGEAGMHARSAIGVAQLPKGAAVEIEMIVSIKYENCL